MTSLRLVLAATALALWSAAAPAATVGGYSSLLVFGDSLSDPGNLYAATGGALPPSPPYFDGRFSNGPIWADHVAARFGAAGLFSANFAFGGADALPGSGPVPDLLDQLGLAAANVPPVVLGPRPLAALWFGANDLFDELDTPTSAGFLTIARAAADAVAAGAGALALNGITDVVLFNLPDLGDIPRFALFAPGKVADAQAATIAFNERLALNAALLRALGVKVTEIDIYSLFEDLQADPAAYGLTNITDPCFVPGLFLCTPEQSAKWLFFDPSHPNFVAQKAIGQAFTAAIVPVPASVLMLGGALAGLALLRRRRAA